MPRSSGNSKPLAKSSPAQISGPVSPYNDGLPDTPFLIAAMNQHVRDQILDRLVKEKRNAS